MKTLKLIAYVLVIIGGLNWGLVGLANYDLVARLLAFSPVLVTLVYDLVGLSAVLLAVTRTKVS